MKNRNLLFFFNSFLIISLILYVFLYDNSRKTIPRFNYISLPASARYFDSLYLIIFSFFLFFKKILSNYQELNYEKLNKIGGGIILLGFISILFNGLKNGNIGEIAYIEGFIKFMRPILLIFIITNLENLNVKFKRAFIILLAILSLNSLIGYWQIIFENARNDNVDALFRSSHFLTTFSFMCIFGIYTYLSNKNKKISMYLIIVFFLIPAIFAEHMRAIVVLLLTIIIYQFFNSYLKNDYTNKIKKILKVSVYTTFTIIIFSYLTLLVQPNIYDKISKALKFASKEIAFISGYMYLPKYFASYPHAILLGKGPGQYGSYVSFDKFGGHISNSPVYKDIRKNAGLTSISVLSPSLDNPSTNLFAIIAEYGLLSFILFILYFQTLFKVMAKHTDEKNVWKKSFMELYLIYLILFSSLDAGYGWENMLTTIPFFILIGLFLRENKINYYKKILAN